MQIQIKLRRVNKSMVYAGQFWDRRPCKEVQWRREFILIINVTLTFGFLIRLSLIRLTEAEQHSRKKTQRSVTFQDDERKKMQILSGGGGCILWLQAGLPGGYPPWHSGSSPPHRCVADGAGRWSAWPSSRHRPGWSSAAARHTPARDPTSNRWRRQPLPSP